MPEPALDLARPALAGTLATGKPSATYAAMPTRFPVACLRGAPQTVSPCSSRSPLGSEDAYTRRAVHPDGLLEPTA